MDLISVKKFIENEFNFFIPSYQRGYRWDKKEVEDLLEDLAEFEIFAKKDEFYCLQPIVLKKENNFFKVVDGQQRLTTIYLILKYLEDLIKLTNQNFSLDNFKIVYETRSESENFLKNIKTKTIQDALVNMDFYYMYKNFEVIKNWFEKNNKTLNFLEILTKDDGRVKFIWYEIENEREEDVFARLNIGKIPLTNAELIKAILLLHIKENKEREILINEWDNIEQKLQDESFFGFLEKNEYKKPSKIEFIFDLVVETLNEDFEYNDKNRKTFYILNDYIKDDKTAKKIWEKVKNYFRIFEEFYSENYFYHLIGYLTNKNSPKNIKEIIKLYNSLNKNEFLDKLKKIIFENFIFEEEEIKYRKNKKELIEIEDLTFSDNKSIINDILFLFNILISNNSRFFRYPFDLHKKQAWSLEHINPQNPYDLDENEKIEILKSYFVDEKLQQKIQKALSDKNYDEILQNLIDSDDDTIGNLTLLSLSHNAKIGNKSFLEKRKEIILLDKNADFIPPATKLAFLKYFSLNPSNLYKWDKEDKNNYIKEIKELFFKFKGVMDEN